MIISIKDNQYKAVPWDEAVSAETSLDEKQQKLLKGFSGISLKGLSEKKKFGNFLVFPSKSARKELEDKDYIFKSVGENFAKPSFLTGNIMGFFRLGNDVQMRITSRFDSSGKNYFLHYMLQRVCNVAIVPQETDSEQDDFFDFLFYLFPSYLNAACRQGIYRAYVTRRYNDANVRGPVDVAKHIRFNTPFNGKIAYHTREYTTDNKVIQLVRHTIEYIRSLQFGGSVFENNEDVRDNVSAVVAATPTYNKSLRSQIIAQNLHPITHPYYTAYEPLRKICLAILCHKKLSYGNDSDNPIAGILFDGASLWEEYLAKVFEDHKIDLVHSNNRDRENGVKIFENGGIYYPDFYRKDSKNSTTIGDCNGLVFDAKYKQLYTVTEEKIAGDEESDETAPDGTNFHFQRNDLFQMLAYMHALKANNAVLVSPYESGNVNEWNSIKFSRDFSKQKTALGYGGEIDIIALPICSKANSFEEFSNYMRVMEENFITRIRKLL